jgi:hypothetical protein
MIKRRWVRGWWWFNIVAGKEKKKDDLPLLRTRLRRWASRPGDEGKKMEGVSSVVDYVRKCARARGRWYEEARTKGQREGAHLLAVLDTLGGRVDDDDFLEEKRKFEEGWKGRSTSSTGVEGRCWRGKTHGSLEQSRQGPLVVLVVLDEVLGSGLPARGEVAVVLGGGRLLDGLGRRGVLRLTLSRPTLSRRSALPLAVIGHRRSRGWDGQEGEEGEGSGEKHRRRGLLARLKDERQWGCGDGDGRWGEGGEEDERDGDYIGSEGMEQELPASEPTDLKAGRYGRQKSGTWEGHGIKFFESASVPPNSV